MSDEDFASLLEEYGGAERSVKLEVGDKVRVKVVHTGANSVFVEVSASQEGSIDREILTDTDGNLTVKPGDTLDAFITSLKNGIELTTKLGRDQIDVGMLENAREQGTPVEGTVTGVNKGGLEVALGNARAFCPIGQADLNFVEDPSLFVGQTLAFQVREVKEGGRNVILSRRALLERERAEQRGKVLEQLEVGQRREGTVTRLAKFGAFVDLGGIDGLIPLGEMSHVRINRPEDVVNVGDQVTVEIIKIEDDPKRAGEKRIGLSLKAVAPDPFDAHAQELQPQKDLLGRVARIETYGAFVDLFEGVQGLVHISELAPRRIGHPKEVVELGQEVTVRVLSVDYDQKRVALSIKQVGGGASSSTGHDGEQRVSGRDLDAINRAQGGQSLGTLGDLLAAKKKNR